MHALRFIIFCIAIPFCLALNPLFCFSQSDSLQNKKIEFDVVFGADRFLPTTNRNVYLPDNIRGLRKNASPYGLSFETYTDIPQFHASVFAGLLTKTAFRKGYNLFVDLIAEELGQSFGSLNLSKTIIYPRIYGTIQDKISVLDREISIYAKAGDFIQYKNNYGLTFHNVDMQGLSFELGLQKWKLSYLLVGDLSQHVGLNANDIYCYNLTYHNQLTENKSLEFGISLNQFALFRFSNNKLVNIISLSGSFKNRDINFYTEIGHRPTVTVKSLDSYLGALVGIEFQKKKKSFDFKAKLKARYYGNSFNEDFYDPSLRYRQQNSFVHGNYVGNYLYPLLNTYREFDQWSVYTEYQNERIASVSSKGSFEKSLIKKFSATLSYEGNLILSDHHNVALYTFYTIGFKYQLPLDVSLEFYGTNKLMNLDAHFQTFYQSIQPLFGYSIRRLVGIYK